VDNTTRVVAEGNGKVLPHREYVDKVLELATPTW
jgi:sulfur carrier protein ThiS